MAMTGAFRRRTETQSKCRVWVDGLKRRVEDWWGIGMIAVWFVGCGQRTSRVGLRDRQRESLGTSLYTFRYR